MPERLVTPAELAVWLNVTTGYIYEHADELGALVLGSGPRVPSALRSRGGDAPVGERPPV